MPERRIDRVQVALSRETITLPWDTREQLLKQIQNLEALRDLREAFETVGTTQPVKLTVEQKGLLLDALEFWSTTRPGGLHELPEGLFELRNALTDDLHRADDA
jgi:hypothetical protein